MIVIMKRNAKGSQIQRVVKAINGLNGVTAQINKGTERSLIAVLGELEITDSLISRFRSFEAVDEVQPISKKYKLAASEYGNGGKVTIQKVINGKKIRVTFGGNTSHVIAGPCTIENSEQMDVIAFKLSHMGVQMLRGGAFKPRTSPYGFRGHGEDGLKILRDVREKYQMLTVTELLDPRDAELFEKYDVDIVQIGTRSMQVACILEEAGRLNKPVIVKRGMSATYEELLLAAEYVLKMQNEKKQVMLCERGIRTYEPTTRNTFDANAISMLKSLSWLPVIGDPSHGSGKTQFVPGASRAAIAVGADGLLVEVHPVPDEALIDGDQSLPPDQFSDLYHNLKRVAKSVGRKLV